ncbi:MAG TPA: FAD-dependent oxidoreductase [Terriglobales bacterium]|nr:FAD-dependent oxidoreductase [Terriglobales bacterium]
MKTVFVIGAGPAGLFAAQKIAQAGHETIVFNRDIKPGGLAEYGIYPTKDKMKVGLRKQFAKVLSLPNLHYFGYVPVSSRSAVSVSELRDWEPSAVVFSVGAQGTKKLGLPGEDAKGVYAAKDFVYHYNLLPPFPSMDFSTGKRIAIIGMGNVMVDIARWLLLDAPFKTAEEIIVVARRGPFEAKFDQKEFIYIEQFLDRTCFDEELQRIQPQLAAVGQEISKLADETFPVLNKPAQAIGERRLRFRFLSSPQQIHPDNTGRIERLTLVENVLFEREGSIGCKATEKTTDLNVDTMIFAIGDVADPALGLPYNRDSYVTNPDEADPKRAAYELFDPHGGEVLDGMYAVGWARKASDGLVGIARHDGEVGATHVLKYLETAQERSNVCADQVRHQLQQKSLRVIDKADLELLARAEEKMAREQGVAWFKFDNDETMLKAIEAEKAKAAPA